MSYPFNSTVGARAPQANPISQGPQNNAVSSPCTSSTSFFSAYFVILNKCIPYTSKNMYVKYTPTNSSVFYDSACSTPVESVSDTLSTPMHVYTCDMLLFTLPYLNVYACRSPSLRFLRQNAHRMVACRSTRRFSQLLQTLEPRILIHTLLLTNMVIT